MDKICFVCDSPFHLMNAVILYRHLKKERDDLTADIYMGDMYETCHNISGCLKETHIFRDVIPYDIRGNGVPSLNVLYYLDKFNELIFPESTMKKRTHCDVRRNEYSELYFTCYADMQFLLMLFNPSAQINCFEEGVGTYLLNPQGDNMYHRRRWAYKLIRRPFPNLTPARLYVNSPAFFSLVQEDAKIIPEQLPPLRPEDTETVNLLSWLFDFRRNPLYDERRIVYLTQPYEEATKTKGREKPVLEACEAFRENIVLKLHPRQRDNSPYQGFDIDHKGELWELVSLLQITDNHILLAPFSTAQLLPKIIFDKEPWLVFMAPLWKEMTPMQSKLIDALRQIYRNPEKVIIVRDVPELSMRLEQILRKGEKKYD